MLRVQLLAIHCQVCTWMGDCLWVDKSFQYVTGHLGQFSLPFLWGK